MMQTMAFEPGSWPRLELSPAVPVGRQVEHMRYALDLVGMPELRQCRPHDYVLEVAAGGPSLADTYSTMTGVVAAVNGSLGYLLDRGIVPKLCAVMDPGEHMADVVVADRRVRYYVASVCHPRVFEKLADCHVTLWHPSGMPEAETLLREKRESSWYMIGGGSTMGLRWINLGYALGFRKFRLHGLDSSFRADATHAYPDRADAKSWVTVNGYPTRLNFVAQVSDFLATMHRMRQPDIEPIEVEVLGDGLLQDTWRGMQGERAKYEAMWRHQAYRQRSPGEMGLEHIVEHLSPAYGDAIIDFGCGSGRATQQLQDAGFEAIGVDIAANCLDPDVNVPLIVSELTDLSNSSIAADHGMCCDVMEHIARDDVDAVLHEIEAAVRRRCYFRIDSDRDSFGIAVGSPLHLTIEPPEWWHKKLSEHFARVDDLGGGRFLAHTE